MGKANLPKSTSKPMASSSMAPSVIIIKRCPNDEYDFDLQRHTGKYILLWYPKRPGYMMVGVKCGRKHVTSDIIACRGLLVCGVDAANHANYAVLCYANS